jgi:hypothetical protein
MAKGKKLDFPVRKVTWRMDERDLALLESAHPDVNDFVRRLVGTYCDRLRVRIESMAVTPSGLVGYSVEGGVFIPGEPEGEDGWRAGCFIPNPKDSQ